MVLLSKTYAYSEAVIGYSPKIVFLDFSLDSFNQDIQQ